MEYDGEKVLEVSLQEGNEYLLAEYQEDWIIDEDWFDSSPFYISALNQAADEILPQLKKRKSSKLIIKIWARIIYERVNRLIPLQVLNFKAFTDILLVGVEMIFAVKQFLWNMDRRSNRIRVETGFLDLGKVIHKK